MIIGSTASVEYNSAGWVEARIDALSQRTTLTYYDDGQQSSTAHSARRRGLLLLGAAKQLPPAGGDLPSEIVFRRVDVHVVTPFCVCKKGSFRQQEPTWPILRGMLMAIATLRRPRLPRP